MTMEEEYTFIEKETGAILELREVIKSYIIVAVKGRTAYCVHVDTYNRETEKLLNKLNKIA